MRLKYVGPLPKVSDRGVSFDKNSPDKFDFLGAALELAEAFDFQSGETEHIYHPQNAKMSESEMEALLRRHCDDLERLLAQSEAKADQRIEEIRIRVQRTDKLGEDAKRAWLGNLEAMREYYLQYTANEAAYECVLNRIAQEIRAAKIADIKVPMFQNFGIVLHDLIDVLENGKPPVDAELIVEERDGHLFGHMRLRHP